MFWDPCGGGFALRMGTLKKACDNCIKQARCYNHYLEVEDGKLGIFFFFFVFHFRRAIPSLQ